MTKIHFFSFALLAVLVSCQRFPTQGGLVRFSAVAHRSAETKTVYGNVNGTRQDILWESGDAVTIYSSNTAVAATESGEASATYTLIVDGTDETKASLEPVAGLRWDEEGSVTFYGVYPAGTTSTGTGQFSMNIPESQSHGIGANTLSNGYMVAKTPVSANSADDVSMEFYPVFTTFEVHLKNGEASTLTLQSFALKSQNSYLSGDYVTDWSGSSRTYTVGETNRSKQAVYNFPSNTTITHETEVVFNLFLLPVTDPGLRVYNDLSLEIKYTNASGDSRTRTLDLKNNGRFVEFAGCTKHVINGLAIDSRDFWKLEVDGTVLPWNGVDKTIDEEVSIAVKVAISGVIETTGKWKTAHSNSSNHYADSEWEEGGFAGYEKNYQIRTLNKDLPSAQRFFTMTFTPTAPTGGYWQLIPQFREDDTQSPRHFRFEHVLPGGGVSSDLQGQILNQQETIRIYPVDWDPSDINTYDVWFTCRFSTSPSFTHAINADSEFQDIHGDGRFSYWVFRIKQYNDEYPTE